MTFFWVWCFFFFLVCMSLVVYKLWSKWRREKLRKKRKGFFNAFVQCKARMQKLREIGAPKVVIEKEQSLLNNIRKLLRRK